MKSSGDKDWDAIRDLVASDKSLRREIELYLISILNSYNPSNQGDRFVVGSLGEWLVAAMAYAAGVISFPDGHSVKSHDLKGLIKDSIAKWSIKSSYSRGGNFGITNGMGGSGKGMTTTTIFWSPEFPGMVIIDPVLRPEIKEKEKDAKDQIQLSKKVVLEFSMKYPECVIPLNLPENLGLAESDENFSLVKRLIESQGAGLKRLGMLLRDFDVKNKSLAEQILELKAMRDSGQISEAQFEAAVTKLTK